MPWPALALLAVALASLAGFLAYPTYPNYDSYYSLLWGRELVHGHLPTFEAYRAPTQHPLAVVFGGLVSLLGGGADRVLVGATMASFVALAAGLYRLGRASYGTLVGLAAGALLCTRFDFPLLALRAYIDIPYLAIVVWAAALEAQRPGAACRSSALLATAGLLRPEAWVLAGVYWLWCLPAWTGAQRRARRRARRARARGVVRRRPRRDREPRVLADPHERAGRGARPRQGPLGGPVADAALPVGARQGAGRSPGPSSGSSSPCGCSGSARASRWPCSSSGSATFALVALGGFSIVFRYLLVPSLMLMLFAALALAGWTLLERGTPARRWWAIGSGVLLAYAVVYLVTHVTPGNFVTDLRYRGGYHRSLEAVLRDPRVQAARRCGPVSLPNHKLVGEVRWILGARASATSSRAATRASGARIRRGAAVYAADRKTLHHLRLQARRHPPGAAHAGLRPGRDRALLQRLHALLGPARRRSRPPRGLSWRRCPPTPSTTASRRSSRASTRPSGRPSRTREGRCSILAGAGSGKTRVLTHRIAYLIHTGQRAAAARSSRSRSRTRPRRRCASASSCCSGAPRAAMWVMTFHAACARILRAEAPRLGYTRQFTIYDQADARRLVKRCLDELGVDPKRFTPAARPAPDLRREEQAARRGGLPPARRLATSSRPSPTSTSSTSASCTA